MENLKIKTNIKLFIFVNLLFIFLAVPKIIKAATLYFSPSSSSYIVGQNFSVSVYVSSEDQAMNGVSGIIFFSKDILEVTSISQTGSIINFWVPGSPSFSNHNGEINFEGVVLNPGYIGSKGKIITINFKIKKEGNIQLNFSQGAILANDGKGTNILKDLGRATFNFNNFNIENVVSKNLSSTSTQNNLTQETKRNVPIIPKIFSLTHPDENKWYANKNPKISWEVFEEITGVKLLFDQKPISIPLVFYPEPIKEKQLENISDGIYYFHVSLRNKFGWSDSAHFKLQIDTQAPRAFKIEIKDSKQTTNPQPTILFETTDDFSGIDYYEIIIDGKEIIKSEKGELKLPSQNPGKHSVIVKAVDKAGNEILSITDFEILTIPAPIIIDYPKELFEGSILTIKGTAEPEATVIIFIQKGNEIRREEIKSDKDGKWLFSQKELTHKGLYYIWAETINSFGAKSFPSERINILVNPPLFLKIGKIAIDYFFVILIFIILAVLIIFITLLFWRKVFKEKQRFRKDINETEEILFRAFQILKKEVEKQIEKLDGKTGLNAREKKINENLKKSLQEAENLIDKKIKELEK